MSALPLLEIYVYQFKNSVSKNRGIQDLTDTFTQSISEINDYDYEKSSFAHPVYKNDKREPLMFKYSDIKLVVEK